MSGVWILELIRRGAMIKSLEDCPSSVHVSKYILHFLKKNYQLSYF